MSELPPKPRPTVEKKSPKEVSINPEVLQASAKAADALDSGDTQTAVKEMNTLVTEVAKDFREHGAPLPKTVEKSLREKITDSINNAGKKTIEKTFSPDMQKDLEQYLGTVKNIEKTYKLSKDMPEFYKAAKGLRNNKVLQDLGLFGLMNSPSRIQRMLQEGKYLVGNNPLVNKVIHGMMFARETLPVVYAFGLIPAVKTQEKVVSAFESSLVGVRKKINVRVAQSVFMRDFEFIHDKPASEIMNIVNKGKESTIELLNETYKNIIPNVALLGGFVGTEMLFAPPAGIVTLLRAPMIARASEGAARTILSERAENLQKRDLIDARVLSSLQSLEVVRTTDSMTNAMKELEQNMGSIDEVEQKHSETRGIRDKRQTIMGLKNLVGAPILAAGWEAFLQWVTLKSSPSRTNEDMTYAGMSIGFTGLGVFAMESQGGEIIENLVNTYTDKIQPSLQDIKRMDDLLGPYDEVDTPDGSREKARQSVEDLKNFDIHIDKLHFKNILHDVSMDVPQGSFVTIKGPSGIGKTTFLRHMLGLFGAEAGVVQYGGQDLSSIKKYGEHSIYSKLAYANQNPQYFENMTLRENLQLWTTQQATDAKLSQVLHDLRLDHIADRMDSKVKHFSGGELRRIGIARALLKDPKVLFLDEPTSNLDQQSAKQVLEIVKAMRVKRPDMTVVAVTHDPNFEGIAEKIVDFAKVNKPKANEATPLGTRQVFYAAANPKT